MSAHVSGRAPTRSRLGAVGETLHGARTIMVKELRSRMRGRRPFVILTAYLALLALVAYGVSVVAAPATAGIVASPAPDGGTRLANASALIGQSIFSVLSIVQLVLVAVIAPALTSGQISLEREKQTFDMLVTTPLSPAAIVAGKLATALAYVILLVLAAIPISAIVFLYGGAQLVDIVRQQVVLLSVAIGFGAAGLFASAVMRRTQPATVAAYCAIIVAILGSTMVYAFWSELSVRNAPLGMPVTDPAPEQIRWVNPMVAMLDIVAEVEATGPSRITEPLYGMFGPDLRGGGAAADLPAFDGGMVVGVDSRPTGHWWPRVSITLLALGLVLAVLSTRFIAPVRRRRWSPAARVAAGTAAEEAPG